MKIENGDVAERKTESKCPDCGKNQYYHDIYDAYFCLSENKWIEGVCNDTDCEYCISRPVKPFVKVN